MVSTAVVDWIMKSKIRNHGVKQKDDRMIDVASLYWSVMDIAAVWVLSV